MSEQTAVVTASRDRIRRRAVIGAAAGNFVEWYEFFVYGAMASIIAPQFFPSDDPASSLLAAFGVYGVAFAARPFGAVLFGGLGDRIGRKRTLTFVILLMSGCTALIGVLPTYEHIGVLAAILLVVMRLGQGLSTGGEFGGAASFVVEHAPDGRRGLYGSWLTVGFGLGLAAGSGLGAALSALLTSDQMSSWGWRLPFLLAVPLGLIGLFLRMRVEESPHFERAKAENTLEPTPTLEVFRRYYRLMITGICVLAAFTIPVYVMYVYVPAHLVTTTDLTLNNVLLLTSISLLVYVALIPFMGLLSDRIGRKPLLFAGTGAQLVLGIPIFLMLDSGETGLVLLGFLLFPISMAPLASQVATFTSEQFPTAMRTGGAAMTYTLANTIFGGGTPFLMTWLYTQTGNGLLPGWIIAASGLVSVLAVLGLRETYRSSLDSPS